MFLYSHWLALPLPTRNKIAHQFGISKTSPTHVQDNRVVSDGYKIDDVERALNIDALQAYTGQKTTDAAVLWEGLIEKIDDRVPAGEVAAIVSEPTSINMKPIAVEKKKTVRKPRTKK